jgi:hypothetical protein
MVLRFMGIQKIHPVSGKKTERGMTKKAILLSLVLPQKKVTYAPNSDIITYYNISPADGAAPHLCVFFAQNRRGTGSAGPMVLGMPPDQPNS